MPVNTKVSARQPTLQVDYSKFSEASEKANHICKLVELCLAKMCPGKHTTSKAKLLLAEILSADFLKGEGKITVHGIICSHICHLFHPWKVVKAGDVSAIGAFKTSTVKALHEVIDENNEGIFPFPSAVDRVHKLLDNHASSLVGFY